jgi:hypothetical protein
MMRKPLPHRAQRGAGEAWLPAVARRQAQGVPGALLGCAKSVSQHWCSARARPQVRAWQQRRMRSGLARWALGQTRIWRLESLRLLQSLCEPGRQRPTTGEPQLGLMMLGLSRC